MAMCDHCITMCDHCVTMCNIRGKCIIFN